MVHPALSYQHSLLDPNNDRTCEKEIIIQKKKEHLFLCLGCNVLSFFFSLTRFFLIIFLSILIEPTTTVPSNAGISMLIREIKNFPEVMGMTIGDAAVVVVEVAVAEEALMIDVEVAAAAVDIMIVVAAAVDLMIDAVVAEAAMIMTTGDAGVEEEEALMIVVAAAAVDMIVVVATAEVETGEVVVSTEEVVEVEVDLIVSIAVKTTTVIVVVALIMTEGVVVALIVDHPAIIVASMEEVMDLRNLENLLAVVVVV